MAICGALEGDAPAALHLYLGQRALDDSRVVTPAARTKAGTLIARAFGCHAQHRGWRRGRLTSAVP